jgi:hypothetical protein
MTGDPHWADVVFLSGFEGGTIVDESPLGQAITLSGSTAASSTWAKFGTQSLSRPNSGTATVPYNAAFFSGTDHFTVEGWFRYDTVAGAILIAQDDADDGDPGWWLKRTGSDLEFQLTDVVDGQSSAVWATWTPSADTDYYICCDFDGTYYRLYVGDTPGGTATMIGKEAHYDYPTTPCYTMVACTAPMAFGATLSSGVAAYSLYNGFLDETRVTAGTARYADDGGFTIPSAAHERGPEDLLDVVMSEGVSLFGGTGLGDVFNETLSQTIGVNQAHVWGRAALSADDIGMTITDVPVKARPGVASDTISIDPDVSALRGIVLVERLRIALSQVPNHEFQLTAQDTARIAAAVIIGLPVTLTEDIGVELTQQVQMSLQIIEELALAPVVAPMLEYGLTISETIRVADALARFFGAAVIDEINVLPAMSGIAARGGTLSETIGLAETVSSRLVLRVIAADEVEIEAEQALQMIFSPVLAEGIEVAAAYLSPGDGVVTWAMNTRTGAVTEYSNYAFNSFAQMGNKYLGANDDGLYELTGDDDDGTNIIATIKSGFAQWSGTHLGSFKAVYLGTRGEGNFVLRLTTGDGKTYNYGVSARDMRTTKVAVGKGLRSRYFAFELISAGQDFDLDTIEFIPLVADRRV